MYPLDGWYEVVHWWRYKASLKIKLFVVVHLWATDKHQSGIEKHSILVSNRNKKDNILNHKK